jgi:hypothetical protein
MFFLNPPEQAPAIAFPFLNQKSLIPVRTPARKIHSGGVQPGGLVRKSKEIASQSFAMTIGLCNDGATAFHFIIRHSLFNIRYSKRLN